MENNFSVHNWLKKKWGIHKEEFKKYFFIGIVSIYPNEDDILWSQVLVKGG